MATGTLKVELVKSGIGFDRTQKATLYGLGLRKRHSTVEVKDTPAARGMIYKVRHLVRVQGPVDPAFDARLEHSVVPPVAAARTPSPWKGVIVVPGPKTEPKAKKKAAKAAGGGKGKKKGKKGKKG